MFMKNVFSLQCQTVTFEGLVFCVGIKNTNLLEPQLTGGWEDILGKNYCVFTLFLCSSLSHLFLATVNNRLAGYMDLWFDFLILFFLNIEKS